MRSVILAVAFFVACSQAVDVPITDRLVLEFADPPTQIRAGERLSVILRVRNVSGQAVRGCLGHAAGLTLRDAQFRTSGEIQTIDHPGCEQRFQLAAGETLELQRTIQTAPLLKEGDGTLSAFVSLVFPPCSEYGCQSENLRARASVTILEGKFP